MALACGGYAAEVGAVPARLELIGQSNGEDPRTSVVDVLMIGSRNATRSTR
jgi:hypothetical protein